MRTKELPAKGKKKTGPEVTMIPRPDGGADVILRGKLKRQILAAAKTRRLSVQEFVDLAIGNHLLDQLPTVPIYTSTHSRLLDAAKRHDMSPTRLAVYAVDYVIDQLESGNVSFVPASVEG